MSVAIKVCGAAALVLAGLCVGVAGHLAAQPKPKPKPKVPDAKLTITPTGETHGGLNGFVLGTPEPGGVTGVKLEGKIRNRTTKELSDSGGASDQTHLLADPKGKIKGGIEGVNFPLWIVKLEAQMQAFVKADFVGNPNQGSYKAKAEYRLEFTFKPGVGAGFKPVTESVTLTSNEIGPKQTDFAKAKITVTYIRHNKKLDATYKSSCEGSISTSRPEPTIEVGASHLQPWSGTAVAWDEKGFGMKKIVRPDGSEAVWNLK